MTSAEEARDALEIRFFVGRQNELAAFRTWLATESPIPEVLNIYGHGGVGKTALLRALRRTARELGRQAVLLDCRDLPPAPQGLLSALVPAGETDPVAALNQARPVLFFDTFEALGGLTRYLEREFLPRLSPAVKIVVAGRQPLGKFWSEDSPWLRIVRLWQLSGLSLTESREYLHRRGIEDPEQVERLARAGGGNPLFLALAADMLGALGFRDLALSPQWHLLVRSLVEHLLQEVEDPELRELLEVCAVIHQFDEEALTAVSGRQRLGAAFQRICQLSVVCPAEHGLTLHDDVRRMLAEDLRWRSPTHYQHVRRRALAYYRERMHEATPAEREWLTAERLFLWGNELLRALNFEEEEPGLVWIEPSAPQDHPDAEQLWCSWLEAAVGITPPPALLADLRTVVRYPETRFRTVRDQDGRAVGFSTFVPVCQETLPMLEASPTTAPAVRALWGGARAASLPAKPDGTILFFRYAGWQAAPKAARAAIFRDLLGLTSRSGTLLVCTVIPTYKALAEALGFRRLPECRNLAYGPAHPVDCYLLDLTTRGGFEAWIEALLAGGRPLTAFGSEELEEELRDILLHWDDAARLAGSALSYLPACSPPAPGPERAEALREVIRRTLAAGKRGPSREALHALELAYLEKTFTRTTAAVRLNVSRATFYRLVSRGLAEMVRLLLHSI
ncbi:MAG: ATP-binding protein [Chloroflexi bacterium]|nr:ATP-binding protein [Chloroflexota bacterium]